jgi:hypothetical protein
VPFDLELILPPPPLQPFYSFSFLFSIMAQPLNKLNVRGVSVSTHEDTYSNAGISNFGNVKLALSHRSGQKLFKDQEESIFKIMFLIQLTTFSQSPLVHKIYL